MSANDEPNTFSHWPSIMDDLMSVQPMELEIGPSVSMDLLYADSTETGILLAAILCTFLPSKSVLNLDSVKWEQAKALLDAALQNAPRAEPAEARSEPTDVLERPIKRRFHD